MPDFLSCPKTMIQDLTVCIVVKGHLVLDIFINYMNLVMGLNLEFLVLGALNINCNNIARNNTNHIKYFCNRVTLTSKTLIYVILTSMSIRHKNTY